MVEKDTNVAKYEVRITDPYGRVLKIIDQYSSLDYARKINEIGELSLVVEDKYPSHILIPENRVEVWRIRGDYARLEMNATWFIHSVTRRLASGGIKFAEINAQDQINLLKRRVIPYNEGNPTTEKQDAADDVIKAIMRENFGTLASDTDRDLSDYISIQADVNLAPQATVFCAKDNVYDVIKEISEASYDSGTYLAFDLAYSPDSGTFEFRTYIGQRGKDRTISTGDGTAIVGLEYGSLLEVAFYDNREDERNFIYANAKDVVGITENLDVSDSQSIGLSPFNRKELILNASSADDADELQTEADAALEANRAEKRVEAKLTQEYALENYGKTFNYGDKVTLSFEGVMYPMYIDAINVKIGSSGETVDVVLVESNE